MVVWTWSVCPRQVMNLKQLFFMFAFIVLYNIKFSSCACLDC